MVEVTGKPNRGGLSVSCPVLAAVDGLRGMPLGKRNSKDEFIVSIDDDSCVSQRVEGTTANRSSSSSVRVPAH